MVTNLIEYLKKQFTERPEQNAVTDGEKGITFGQLYWAAMDIAQRIQQHLNGELNRPVVIYLNKGLEEYCSLLGVLCSGNYYVPVDINMPVERVCKIFELIKPGIIITSEKLKDKIEKTGYRGKTVEINELCTLEKGGLIKDWTEKIIDTDPAYILFTSGSTGIPKGVVVSHRAVIDYIEWQCKTLPFDETSILGSQAPFYFDASMPDIFTTIKCGSRLVIIPEILFVLPNKLIAFIREMGINTLIWVPSALMTLSSKDYLALQKMDKLRLIMFCGEVFPTRHLNIWRKYYPEVKFVNLYGPTEAAYACTYYIINREFEDTEVLPIGFPCENTDILVLDENDMNVRETGKEGELCIRGSSLANGYYNNSSRTSEVFVINPLNPFYDEIIYRTGDIVKYNDFGELVYIGRKDFQIKHMGYRIELGEVETAAYSITDMVQCCAIYDSNRKRIVLYCAVNNELSEKEIYRQLKDKIPKYMLPNRIQILEQLPLNENGKINRAVLRKKTIENNE